MSDWIERYHGSHPQKGWTIVGGGEEIVYLGESASSEQISKIIAAHNARVQDLSADNAIAPTQGADARPVAIYQGKLDELREWRDISKKTYDNAEAHGWGETRIVYATRDAATRAQAPDSAVAVDAPLPIEKRVFELWYDKLPENTALTRWQLAESAWYSALKTVNAQAPDSAVDAPVGYVNTASQPQFLLIAMDDDGVAHLTGCADYEDVKQAVSESMFMPGDLLPEHVEELGGVLLELMQNGVMRFEGDPALHLYRLPR
jgi:hypothetical protein